mgnify:FL=1
MYEYISGPVAEVAPAYAVIDAGGVGYYLHISLETFSAIEHTETARLYVHYVVREDAQLFFGGTGRDNSRYRRKRTGKNNAASADSRAYST